MEGGELACRLWDGSDQTVAKQRSQLFWGGFRDEGFRDEGLGLGFRD